MGFGHDFERDEDGRVEDFGLGCAFAIVTWIVLAAGAAVACWWYFKGVR